eukprot:11169759-Lingulodinium_polyedra.AAC.1
MQGRSANAQGQAVRRRALLDVQMCANRALVRAQLSLRQASHSVSCTSGRSDAHEAKLSITIFGAIQGHAVSVVSHTD